MTGLGFELLTKIVFGNLPSLSQILGHILRLPIRILSDGKDVAQILSGTQMRVKASSSETGGVRKVITCIAGSGSRNEERQSQERQSSKRIGNSHSEAESDGRRADDLKMRMMEPFSGSKQSLYTSLHVENLGKPLDSTIPRIPGFPYSMC